MNSLVSRSFHSVFFHKGIYVIEKKKGSQRKRERDGEVNGIVCLLGCLDVASALFSSARIDARSSFCNVFVSS